jgi:hypothetical protein
LFGIPFSKAKTFVIAKQSSTDISYGKVTVTSIVQRLVKGNTDDLNGSKMNKGNDI